MLDTTAIFTRQSFQRNIPIEIKQHPLAIVHELANSRTVFELKVGNAVAYQRVVATEIVVSENAPHPSRNIGGTIPRIHKVADNCIQSPRIWVWFHDGYLGSRPIQDLRTEW